MCDGADGRPHGGDAQVQVQIQSTLHPRPVMVAAQRWRQRRCVQVVTRPGRRTSLFLSMSIVTPIPRVGR